MLTSLIRAKHTYIQMVNSGFCKRILKTKEVHFFPRQSKTLKHERRFVRDRYRCGYKQFYSAQRDNYMNIIRSVIKKAFVWRNRCSSTGKRCKTFGCFRVAILGSFMAGFLLLFNCCRVRCSSLMNLSGLPCHIS